MAAAPKKTPKTESLTIRLDPKTRFILEFVARLRGQPLTTVVERFITDGANQLSLDFNDGRTWKDFWDVSEGVRALLMANEPALYPTYEEEKRLAFAREHWPFFYVSEAKKTLRRIYIDILWPGIDTFVTLHEQGKTTDYWNAGRLMQNALSTANVVPPEWPVGSGSKGGSNFGAREKFEGLDDEIPF